MPTIECEARTAQILSTMRYLFDTSSLSVLARYYQPFDKDNELFEWFKGKFDAKEIPCKNVVDVLSHTSLHLLFE